MLNVTPDHLDRHRTFAAYVDAKARIFENQQADDFAVLNADDPTCVELAGRTRAQVFWFSRKREVKQGAFVRKGAILFRRGGTQQEVMLVVGNSAERRAQRRERSGRGLCWVRSWVAKLAKIRAARSATSRRSSIGWNMWPRFAASSTTTTPRPPTWMRPSRRWSRFPANIHLILGGKDKGSDYTRAQRSAAAAGESAFIRSARRRRRSSRRSRARPEIVPAETLEIAVKQAAAAAQPGDIVLLAPACASFDQFQNYEHRGRVFKEMWLAAGGAVR